MMLDPDLHADWYEDARRESLTENMECEECGAAWYSPIIRATRYQPAEATQPDCPECGC